ncbi:MAG TPA: carboxypeptidase regulatory-like domain-containing protein [Natronosporangium sp.]
MVGLAPPAAAGALAAPPPSTVAAPAEPTATLPVAARQSADVPDAELRTVFSGLREEEPERLPTAPADGAAGTPAGIEAEVQAAVEADGEVPVIIRLRQQADLAAVAEEAKQAGRAAAAAAGREQGARFAGDAARAAQAEVVVEALQSVADTSQSGVRSLLARHDAEAVREFWIINGIAATVDQETLAALAAHPDVASVTLDDTITLEDPEIEETGEPLLPGWNLDSVNAPDVWGEYGVRGAGVVVGVMDSGVDIDHPALGRAWRGNDGDVESSWFVPTGENYPRPGDFDGHGTHVTGSILGAPPGQVIGVAPDAQWIAAKVFRDGGSTTDSILHAGFEWMLAPGGDPAAAPDVVNNSWGSNDGLDTEFWDDVAAWVAAGIVPIFANGNAGPGTGTVGSPASFPHSIGVGAIDSDDRPAYFSSRGPVIWDGVEYQKPQLSAPGYQVFSSLPGGGYGTANGTSMAAPHVTGVVALMLSAAPGLTVDQVRSALIASARSNSQTDALPNAYGAGIADAYAAVTYVSRSGTVTGTVTGPDGAPVEAEVSAGGQTATAAGGQYELRLPAGSYELRVSAYGYQPQTRSVTVPLGGTVTVDVAMAAAPERIVTGTVSGPSGAIPDARVVIPPLPATRTDQHGRFQLTVAEGTYQLRAAAAGFDAATVPVTVAGDTELAVTLTPATGPSQPGWSIYQNNPARTGLGTELLAGETLAEAWTADAGGEVVFSSPVIGDGRLFVNVTSGALAAFDLADGSRLWQFPTSEFMRGAPAVADGVVYAGGGLDGGIHALDAATGELQWEVPTPDRFTVYSAPVVRDGVVYVTTGPTSDRSDTVFALDAVTGEQLWATDIGSNVFFGPAVADGIVAAASEQQLVALDAATGEVRWTLPRDELFVASPSIADGTVYATTTVPEPNPFATTTRGSLIAVDAATGELRWEVAAHGDGEGTAPAVYGDLVIAGSHGLGMVAAYNRHTGEPVWHYGLEVSGGVSSSIMVSGDGYVVAGAQLDRRIFVLDAATGELVWEQRLAESVVSSPAFAEGRLVVADADGGLHAYHPSGELRGHIAGPDGPLPATVRLLGTEYEATADAAGNYTLPGVPPGEYQVEASHFGFGAQTRTVTVLAGQVIAADFTLAPVGNGAIAGTILDPDGQPIAGATVTLPRTPLPPVVTGPDGRYAFEPVSEGNYTVTVVASGFITAEQPVTVVAGETATGDVTLERYDAAVVADFRNRLTDTLTEAGLRVEQLTFAEAAQRAGDYPVVVLNGNLDDQADADLDRFRQLVETADAGGASLVVLGTWGVSFGSIRSLSLATGDPAHHDYEIDTQGTVWLTDPVPHPLTAALGDGRTPLLTRGGHDWFDDYSGYALASIGNDRDGVTGIGIGFQPRTLTSSHILLAGAAATTPTAAPDWQPTVRTLLVDAVEYALTTDYGAVAGQVTGDDGQPLPATIEVADRFERTTAGPDGSYRLLLEPGDYTLRIDAIGTEPVELPVTVAEGQTLTRDVTLPAVALGVLTGQVAEQGTGAPVAGASVTVADREPVTTGPDGRYVIEDLPGGEYRVEFSAVGYESLVVDPVTVTEGEVTTLDAELVSAPGVVVMGDTDGELTAFLSQHGIPVREAGWEVVDDLDGVEVVIMNHPSDPGEETFLAALDAFDAAGVSVIFPASGLVPSVRTRGVTMLSEYTGSPADIDSVGGTGIDVYLHEPVEHPIFEGVGPAPLPVVTGDTDGAIFVDYRGTPLGQVGESAEAAEGLGFAYEIRGPESVHVLLSGLSASFRSHPNGNWTDAGRQIFLNAVRWAADPGLGELTGAITDLAGEPIRFATVEVLDTDRRTTVAEDGSFSLAVPPGDYTVRVSAFGYVPQELPVTVAAGQVLDLSTRLALGSNGAINGTVTAQGGGPLGGVSVILHGTPYRTVTEPDGSYVFHQIEPGSYELELEIEGHVRTLAAVDVVAGTAAIRDVALRPSPLVGIIDDSTITVTRDRGKEFLLDWGYRVEEIDWRSLDRIPHLDLIVANEANITSATDPGPAELNAFLEAVNRAGVSVIWMGQSGRGAIRFLTDYDGDPAVRGQDLNDGPVVATVVEDHPLVAGLPDSFELLTPNSSYAWFNEFSGVTVATLSSNLGELGGTIGYRGRTAGAVDVLLSTMSISTDGGPSTRQSPPHRWTPAAERVLVNALEWALTADGLGADVRGTVTSDRDGLIPSQVEVVETGRTYQGRAGDGTFLVPLPPGSWTLRVTAFGHEPAELPVTVQAGQSLTPTITLTASPAGTVSGTITGPDGAPVAGAEVTLVDTPLAGVSGADGRYTIGNVPAGDWTLRVTADGLRSAHRPVTVPAGQTIPVDVQLKPTAPVAIVDTTGSSPRGTELAQLLRDDGYQVEMFARNAAGMTELAGRVDEFELVIFNVGAVTSGRPEYRVAMDAVTEAGVSAIYASQFNGEAIGELSDYRGDPQDVEWDFVPPGVDVIAHEPHPIFDGFPIGEPIELITSNLSNHNQQWSTYSGWSGTTIANLHVRHQDGVPGEDLGEVFGYRFTSPESVEILLGSLSSGGNGSPTERWTDQARRIYLNAVAWAVEVTQAQLTGVVTGAGEPLAGATVTAGDATAVTGPDGSYTLGLVPGTHTVVVSAFGYLPETREVTVPETGSATLDVDLTPLPRGSVTGLVSSTTGAPVAGAVLTGTGPVAWTATTGPDGRYQAVDLLEGDYEVTVTADGFLPTTVTVTVTAGEPVPLDVTLRPVDVGVLGDIEGTLTAYLRDAGVAAAELPWDAGLDLAGYQVVVVNGGSPSEETFDAVLAAADAAEVSLVFTGTWAADRGGIRLLERYTDRVVVGTQGFGDGPVQLTGFDPAHPIFANLGEDPATLIVEGGYYSVLEEYAGRPLADLSVPRAGADPVTGLAVGWDWRTAGSVELLLSASAVTEAVGPGLGWTPAAGQLLVDAINWAGEQVLSPPAAPTLTAEAPVVVTETVTVSGQAEWPWRVTVLRDGVPVATAEVADDGSWSAEVPLSVGDNELVAVASNPAGDSPASAPVSVARWVPEWTVRGQWPTYPVMLSLTGPAVFGDPADQAQLVVRDPDGDEVQRVDLQWVGGFYLHVLRDLPRGSYTLDAELTVDGHLLVIEGPTIS